MDSIFDTVYDIIKASASADGWVDMTLLRQNLRDVYLEYEYYEEIVGALQEQGLLVVWPSGEFVVPKTGWRCSQCAGIVDGLWSGHTAECLRRQRKIKQERTTRTRAKADGTSSPR
jgi:hypothetical protein